MTNHLPYFRIKRRAATLHQTLSICYTKVRQIDLNEKRFVRGYARREENIRGA